MNYRVPRTRKEIFETLVKGLQRLEYRGYDSAGRPCRLLFKRCSLHLKTRKVERGNKGKRNLHAKCPLGISVSPLQSCWGPRGRG